MYLHTRVALLSNLESWLVMVLLQDASRTAPLRLWDVNDLAEHLGVSVATIYRRRSLGEPLPRALKIGHSVRWKPEVVEAWIAEQTG